MKRWIYVFFKLKSDNKRYNTIASLRDEVIFIQDDYEKIKTYLINKYGDDFMGIESYGLYTEKSYGLHTEE